MFLTLKISLVRGNPQTSVSEIFSTLVCSGQITRILLQYVPTEKIII